MKFLLSTLLAMLVSFSYAQNSDSTSLVKIPTPPHSASRAAKLSAIVPGLGQVYNKQAWKTPIIYAGAGALIYSIAWNNNNYQKYLSAYKLDSDTSLSTNSEFANLYSVDNLIVLKDFYRRNRDLSAIGLVLVYAANIVDAYVYGQFFNFDVSDDLSLHVQPYVVPQIQNVNAGTWTTTAGLSLQFKFR